MMETACAVEEDGHKVNASVGCKGVNNSNFACSIMTLKACSHIDAHSIRIAIRHRLMRIECASIAFTLYF